MTCTWCKIKNNYFQERMCSFIDKKKKRCYKNNFEWKNFVNFIAKKIIRF